MNSYIGCYGWIRSHDESSIIEGDSLDETINTYPWWYRDLVCVAETDDELTLNLPGSAKKVRVPSKEFEPLGKPTHQLGDRVVVKKSGKHATVVRVNWHSMREKFFFTLDYGDRVSTNWFFDEDIEPESNDGEARHG